MSPYRGNLFASRRAIKYPIPPAIGTPGTINTNPTITRSITIAIPIPSINPPTKLPITAADSPSHNTSACVTASSFLPIPPNYPAPKI